MNQIPNIEETYNTREVEEKKYPSHKELDMEKYYRIVKSGSFDNMFNYGFEVGKAFHHQQLQKARQDWLREEIVRLEKDFLKGDPMHDAHQFYQVIHFNEAIQTIIDRYQTELNQDNK